MENRTMQLMENAFYDGAYSLVFDLSSDAIKDPNVDTLSLTLQIGNHRIILFQKQRMSLSTVKRKKRN